MNLLYIPTKRRYHSEDAFFSEGDIAIRAAWFQKQDSLISEDWDSVADEVITSQRNPIDCDLQPCKGYGRTSFANNTAYELHYDMWHRHICGECHKSFPGEQWLEFHFDEFHDVMKAMAKEKGEKIYKCYVPGCLKLFSTPKMRRLHLIDKHCYSRLYPFDLPLTGNMSFKERQRRLDHNKKMLETKKAGGPPQDSRMGGRNAERMKVEKAASTGTSESLDTAMEEITQGIAKLRVPKSISFGRASRGLHSQWASSKQHGSSRQHNSPNSMALDHPTDNAGNKDDHSNHTEEVKGDATVPNRRNRNRKKARDNKRLQDIEMGVNQGDES